MDLRQAAQGEPRDPTLVLVPEWKIRVPGTAGGSDGSGWGDLPLVSLSRRKADRARLISFDRSDPAHAPFDMLRTRLLQAFRDKGWRRVAISSPTKGCGKTFVSANLALALARQRGRRVALVDLDLRAPSLGGFFERRPTAEIAPFLEGRAAVREAFCRLEGTHLALGLNDVPLSHPAETLHDASVPAAFARLQAELEPDAVLIDTPPMLACDDLLALAPMVDCVLMVAGGGLSTAAELRRCAKMLEGRAPILGIVLNRAEDPDVRRYYY